MSNAEQNLKDRPFTSPVKWPATFYVAMCDTGSPPPAPKSAPASRKDWSYIAGQWLDEVAAGTEQGIRDTHAWKESVRKFGLQETRRLLRLSLLASPFPDGNPRNWSDFKSCPAGF